MPTELTPGQRDAFLIALTFATGVADVASYLGLGQIFTANMTGNTVFLAIAIGQAHVLTGIRSAEALAGFGAGAFFAGRFLGARTTSPPWPAAVTQALGVELVFAGAFTGLWLAFRGLPSGAAVFALISLSSVGMGIQSAAARKLAVPSVTTNVLTMAFTGLMAELTALGISGSPARRWAAVVLAMAGGAVLGGWLFEEARPLVPVPMLIVLAGVCLLAYRRQAVRGHESAPAAPTH